MFTILVVFVTLAFAFLLYSSLQDDIPDELSFLRTQPAGQHAVVAGAKVSSYKGWRVTQMGTTVELIKQFEATAAVGTVAYPPPEIGILCFDNKLDIRVDTKSPTTGTTSSPVAVDRDPAQEWGKGKNTNLFPPQASQLLRDMVRATSGVTLTLSYRTLGLQPSSLDVSGLPELIAQLPSGCRP
jgi:hypothetical protein